MSDSVIRMGYDDKEVAQGLKRTGSHLRAFESQTKGLFKGIGSGLTGAFSILGAGAGIAGAKMLVDQFDRIGDLAKQLDQSAESVQRLGAMAKLSGADLESVARAQNRLNRTVAEGSAAAAFKELGINIEKYLALDADQQILMLARAFQDAEQKGLGLSAAYDLFGKSAAELLPLLRSNVAELEKASQIKVISDEQMADLQQFNDDFDRLVMNAKAGLASMALEAKKNFGDAWEALTRYLEGFDRAPGGMGGFAEHLNQVQAESATEDDFTQEQIEGSREVRKQAAARTAEIEAAARAAKEEADECERSAAAHERAARDAERMAEAAKRAADQAQREADIKNKARDARLSSIRDLEMQMKILELRAAGRNKEADALEREARIKEEASRIAKETGMDEAKALEVAKRKAELEDKIAKNGERNAQGRRKIHGYSHAQRATNPHLWDTFLYSPNDKTPFFQKHQRTPNLDAHPWKRAGQETRNATQKMEQKLDRLIENTAPLKDK